MSTRDQSPKPVAAVPGAARPVSSNGKGSIPQKAAPPSNPPKRKNNQGKRVLHYFKPASQVLLIWLLWFSCCAAFILTIYYAFGTSFLFNSRIVTRSPSNTILVIRVLSAVTELLLVELVAGCFERLKWMLVTSKSGVSILDFLTLSEGTGATGWFAITFSRVRSIQRSRWWTLVRLAGLLLPPALGIVILSDTTIETTYVSNASFRIAGGIGDFTPSYASDNGIRLISGISLASDFSNFLTNPKLSTYADPIIPTQSSCINGGGILSQGCAMSYFVSGGLELISPWPVLNYTLPQSPFYTVRENSGYHFDFSTLDGSATFDGTTDCTLYGGDNDAVLVCLALSADHALNTKFIPCPIDITGKSLCTTDTSWQASTGWTGTLRTYRQTATVQYYRSNQTIAALSDLSKPEPLVLSPHNLFSTYNSTFNAAGGLGEYTAGRQFIQYLHNFLIFASTSTSTQNIAADQLRNLVVLPLYYFQPTNLNPGLEPSPNTPAPGLPQALYTTAAFSDALYRLIIGRATLIIYLVLGSVLLVLCLILLVLGSSDTFAGRITEPTPFTMLDIIGCEDSSGVDDLMSKLRGCRGLNRRRLLEELKKIRIKGVIPSNL